MKYNDKRLGVLDRQQVQQGNRNWWTDHTMSYDWKDKSGHQVFSQAWFDDIDRRFLHAARLCFRDGESFATLMSADTLAGKKVLEIGCGMGFHSELLARAGAEVTSIDLSPTSVQATRARLALKNLPSDVRQMDAEALEFPDGYFDMVWSWGVIHHSSRTGRIVRGIERVLRPGGNARLMVYNLEGMPAYVTLVTRYLAGFWRGRASLDEYLWRSTDGFSARFYTRDIFADLLLAFFESVETRVMGQEPDVVPLPSWLRKPVLKMIPLARQREAVRRRGAFLFAVATKNG